MWINTDCKFADSEIPSIDGIIGCRDVLYDCDYYSRGMLWITDEEAQDRMFGCGDDGRVFLHGRCLGCMASLKMTSFWRMYIPF